MHPRLRFNSVKNRLNLPHPDCTSGQQLQTMRELTPETASLLQIVLHSNGKHGSTTFTYTWLVLLGTSTSIQSFQSADSA